MKSASRDEIVKLIDRALAGKVSREEVVDLCPDAKEPELLRQAWHAVFHFVDDEDIRPKNPGYDAWSREHLEQFKRELLEAV